MPRSELTKRIARNLGNTGLVLLTFLVLSGCSLFQETPERLTLTSKYDRAFDEVRNVLSNRFEIKTADKEKGRVETAWRLKPSEMGTERTRIISRVKDSEDRPGQIRITLRSEVQRVSDILRPYETEDADWESASRNREMEQDLIKLIRFRLKSKEMEEDILEEVEEGAEQEQRLEELKRETEEGNSDQ